MRKIGLFIILVAAIAAAGQNQNQTATKALTLNVVSPVAISNTSLPAAIVGKPYTATLLASGGTPPYTWAVTAGTVPPGLSLTPSTGAIGGTATGQCSSNPCNITIQVTDSTSTVASIQLNWSPSSSPGVASYNVYRGIKSGGPYAKIANVKASPFIDFWPRGQNISLFYVATAIDAQKQESVYSNEALAVVQ